MDMRQINQDGEYGAGAAAPTSASIKAQLKRPLWNPLGSTPALKSRSQGVCLLRDAGAGPTILVSPLLALMRNQIQMAERAGVVARTIDSENRDDWGAIRTSIERDEVDLLLVSPERFNNPAFRADVLPQVAARSGLLVIDEAHRISGWGHDFRPDYRRLVRFLELPPHGVPVLCTTATANDRVVEDIQAQVGAELATR